jgi:predicted ATP-dependent endonuclease of OLD family
MEITDDEKQFESPITLPENENFFVIVGANNSGKTTLLRSITKTKFASSYMVSVNRTVLRGEGAIDKIYQGNYIGFLEDARRHSDDNTEKRTQALQDFFGLNDDERKPIIEWYNSHFPSPIYEERENPSNSASSMLLKVDNNSITKQGSGMRSTLEIFIKLFDPYVRVLCIDEPELGLEPRLQKYLFLAIKGKASQTKKIFIATHSHHFLDYEDESNNFVCTRNSNGLISVKPSGDIKQIIFRLLGNTLSSLLLPENIIVLEGSSDTTYLNKCLLLLNKKGYASHSSGSDTNISYAVNSITQFLKFNKGNLSVYKDKIYVIADQQMKDINIREWKKLLPNELRQLKVLPQNGIEYFYPERILQQIFNTHLSRRDIIEGFLKSSPNAFNGFRLTKVQLAQKVSEVIDAGDLTDTKNDLFEFLKSLP